MIAHSLLPKFELVLDEILWRGLGSVGTLKTFLRTVIAYLPTVYGAAQDVLKLQMLAIGNVAATNDEKLVVCARSPA